MVLWYMRPLRKLKYAVYLLEARSFMRPRNIISTGRVKKRRNKRRKLGYCRDLKKCRQ